MAYLSTIGNLSLSQMAKQSEADWLEDLDVLRSAGLSEYGVSWLTANVRAPYEAKLAYDVVRAKAIADWRAGTAGVPSFFAEYLNYYKSLNPSSSLWYEMDSLEGAKAVEESFREKASYLAAWPFPNVPLANRTVNGWPIIFGFKLNGDVMNTAAEYREYWFNLFSFPSNAYVPDAWNLAFKVAQSPAIDSFLNKVVDAVKLSYVSRMAGTRNYSYALQWPYGYPTEVEKALLITQLTAALNATDRGGLSSGMTALYDRNINAGNLKIYLDWFRRAVESEILFRFGQPVIQPPRRKRSWWQKALSTYIPFVAPIIAIATGGLATGLVAFASMKAGEMVSKEVGGIGGIVLGGITSGAVGGFSQLAGFIPSASSLAPSYQFTNSILSVSPLPAPINQVLGKGLDAYIQSYIGITPETLDRLNVSPVLQAAAIAGSIAAPKAANLALGSLAVVGQFDKLTTPTDWETFLPAAKTTALAFAPDYAQQIRVAYEVGKGLPQAIEGLTMVPQMLTKGLEYLGEGLVKLPELVGELVVKAPELAVKGATYTLTHATPLILEGVQEAGKAIIQAPELALKGAEFVAVKAPPLVLEGLEETGKVFLEAPQLALKGTSFVLEKSAPLALEALEETGKAALEVPQLVMKGAAFTLEKSAPLVLEGLEEAGKAALEVPQLAVKGMSYVLEKAPALVVDVLEQIPKIGIPELPSVSMVQIPSLAYQTLTAPQPQEILIERPITTIVETEKTVVPEKVAIGQGASGEEIIHLPAMPIEDNTPLLLALGGLAVLAVTIAATE